MQSGFIYLFEGVPNATKFRVDPDLCEMHGEFGDFEQVSPLTSVYNESYIVLCQYGIQVMWNCCTAHVQVETAVGGHPHPVIVTIRDNKD